MPRYSFTIVYVSSTSSNLLQFGFHKKMLTAYLDILLDEENPIKVHTLIKRKKLLRVSYDATRTIKISQSLKHFLFHCLETVYVFWYCNMHSSYSFVFYMSLQSVVGYHSPQFPLCSNSYLVSSLPLDINLSCEYQILQALFHDYVSQKCQFCFKL